MDHNLSLGEKLETIIYSRKNGKFGQYLGSTSTIFGAACIDNIIYHVLRNIEVDSDYFWMVKNINTGKSIKLTDEYDLPALKTL